MAGELMEKYIVERIESLEEALADYKETLEYNNRQWDELCSDMKAVLKMLEVDYDKKIIKLDAWEKYDSERYNELKRILKSFGMWKEVEPCEQEGVDSDTSQETAATSEG